MYVYPEKFTNEKGFANVVRQLNVALHNDKAGQHQLTGHQFSAVKHGRATAFATWASSFSSGEKLRSIIPRTSGPVASLGKVLGNRTTLYKYLNPHLFAVTTASPTTCGVYVIDAAKGNIVYYASITASQGKGSCDLHATFVENWLVYVYWDEEYQWVGQSKGHKLVTVELYEGSVPDDKTRRWVCPLSRMRCLCIWLIGSSPELSSYSNKSLAITIIEQSYVFPHAITSIATTSTKHGISTKDVIGVSHLELAPARTNVKLVIIQWRTRMARFNHSLACY